MKAIAFEPPPTHETHKLANNEITLFTAIELEIGTVIAWMRKEEAASERAHQQKIVNRIIRTDAKLISPCC